MKDIYNYFNIDNNIERKYKSAITNLNWIYLSRVFKINHQNINKKLLICIFNMFLNMIQNKETKYTWEMINLYWISLLRGCNQKNQNINKKQLIYIEFSC